MTAENTGLGRVRVWRPADGVELIHVEEALSGNSMFCDRYAVALTPVDHATAATGAGASRSPMARCSSWSRGR